MALSDHEKRLLDEIEDSLTVDAPRLASSLRNPRAFHRVRRGSLRAGGLIAGILLTVLGVHANNTLGTIIALLGFGLIVATAFAMWSTFPPSRRKRPN
jgi:hypothetical protein